jgi:hypothetical protein
MASLEAGDIEFPEGVVELYIGLDVWTGHVASPG